jgi:hypothetical protein
MKAENKCHTKCLDKMDSIMATERTFFDVYKTFQHRRVPHQDGEPRKTCNVGSKTRAEKMKVPMSKVQLGMVPLSNVQAATAKVDARRNIRHLPDRNLVIIPYVESQAQLQ